MNYTPFITCALTGGGGAQDIHPDLPITPEQIATAGIEAAKAGAAIVHIHVREPDTGKPSRRLELYREVVERIRSSDVDVLINLTCGMGGELVVGDGPDQIGIAGSDVASPEDRVAHVVELLPDICTIDLATMNFDTADMLYLAPLGWVEETARRIQAVGVKPELEAFDIGHIGIAKHLISKGLVDDPVLMQLCLGVANEAPPTTQVMQTMISLLPEGCVWSALGTSRSQMPTVAQAALLGGNVRVGLEDNLYLSRGVFASNAQLVERARVILEGLGATIAGPDEVRERLQLKKRQV